MMGILQLWGRLKSLDSSVCSLLLRRRKNPMICSPTTVRPPCKRTGWSFVPRLVQAAKGHHRCSERTWGNYTCTVAIRTVLPVAALRYRCMQTRPGCSIDPKGWIKALKFGVVFVAVNESASSICHYSNWVNKAKEKVVREPRWECWCKLKQSIQCQW